MRQAHAVVEAGGDVLSAVLMLRSGITFGEGGAALSGRSGVVPFGVGTGASPVVVEGGGALTIVV